MQDSHHSRISILDLTTPLVNSPQPPTRLLSSLNLATTPLTLHLHLPTKDRPTERGLLSTLSLDRTLTSLDSSLMEALSPRTSFRQKPLVRHHSTRGISCTQNHHPALVCPLNHQGDVFHLRHLLQKPQRTTFSLAHHRMSNSTTILALDLALLHLLEVPCPLASPLLLQRWTLNHRACRSLSLVQSRLSLVRFLHPTPEAILVTKDTKIPLVMC